MSPSYHSAIPPPYIPIDSNRQRNTPSPSMQTFPAYSGLRMSNTIYIPVTQESTPLLQPTRRQGGSCGPCGVITVLFIILIGSVALQKSYDSGYSSALDTFYNPRVREIIRKQWESERRQAEEEQQKWELDRKARGEQWKREEEDWYQKMEKMRKREEDKRTRLNIRFASPQPQHSCKSYGVREYSAQLMNVPTSPGYDGIRACALTSVEINGVMFDKPTWCENTGKQGGIIGHWDFHNESACKPFFVWFKDKGCTARGSRIRRFESPLENLYSIYHWEQMCSTTPADFNGMHFERPSSCANWGQHGIWGIWFVEDSSC